MVNRFRSRTPRRICGIVISLLFPLVVIGNISAQEKSDQKIKSETENENWWAERAAAFFPKYHLTLQATGLRLTDGDSGAGKISAPDAISAAIVWNNTSTDFNANGSWGGGTAPGTGDIATFTGAANVSFQPNVTANKTVSGINFSTAASSGYNLTSSSGAIQLTLNSVVATAGSQAIQSSNTSGTNTINAPLVLNGAAASTQTIFQAAGGTLTLNGVISSTNNITLSLSSTGTFNLNGANTYTGTTSFVNAGSIIGIGNASAFGTSTINFIGNSFKANVDLTGANKLTNAITLGGSPTFLDSGSFGLEFGGNVDMGNTNRTITSQISGGLIFDGNFTNGAGNTLTFVTSNGSVVTMKGTNTYTGNTTISGTGMVSVSSIGNSGSSGNLGAGTTINLGATTAAGFLLYTGTGETTSKIINLAGTTGGATIDQSGTGLLKFTGTNTASGVGDKTLTLQGSTAGTGEISGAIIDNSGTNTTSLFKAGTGTWTLSGANTYTGGTTVSNGTLIANGAIGGATGGLTVSAANGITSILNLNVSQTVASLSGSLAGTGSATINIASTRTLTSSQTVNSQYDGILAGAGAFTKSGTGTLTLTGANAYTGATAVSAGVLNIQNDTGLGTTAGSTTVSSGATLQLQNNITVGAEALNINGTGASGQNGALVNISGTNEYGGLLTLAGATTLSSDSGLLNLTNTGTITGATFGLTLRGSGNGTLSSIIGTTSGTLTKSGTGTWTLSGANTYTGTTAVSAGVLNIQNATGLGTTGNGTTVSSGATLQLQNNITVGAEALNISGIGASGQNGALVNVSGTNNYGGLLTLALATTISSDLGTLNLTNTGTITGVGLGLTLTGSGDGTVSSIIGTTTGTLTKTGAGTWTLLGVNTYTGLTSITAGTLAEGVTNAISTGALTVNGASAIFDLGASHNDSVGIVTLDGGGAINGTSTSTLTSTGTFELKNGTVNAILGGAGIVLNKTTAGAVTLNAANTYTGLTNITAGTLVEGVDNAISTGALTINGATAAFDLGASHNDSVGTVTLAGGGTINGTGTSTLTSTGSFELQNGTVNAILAGSVALNKTTAGTVTLNALNSYTGATLVAAGTLRLGISGALPSGTALTVGTSGATAGQVIFDLNGFNQTIASLQLLGGNTAATNSGIITLGGGTLTVNGNIAFETGSNNRWPSTISGAGALDLGGATRTFNIFDNANSTTGGDLQISSIIQNGGITKAQTGILTLSGANTYAGLTTVSAGVLNIQNDTALGTTAAGTSVATGAALQLQAGITVGNEALTLTGTGIATDGALRNISGANVWQGTVTLAGATRINSDAGSLTFNTAANSITGTNTALTLGGAGNGTVGGTITTGSGTLTKDGAGTWTLFGANTYTGLTTVSAGVLNIQNDTALGTTAAGTSVTGGATLQLQGGITLGAETLILDGAGIGSGGALRNISADNLWGGTITINSTTRINSDSGTLTLDVASGNAITGSNDNLQFGGSGNVTINDAIATGTGTVTKDGTGTLTLNGASTYTGATTISAGVLSAANNLALGTIAGGVTVSNGAALELDGTLGNLTIGAESLSLVGTGISNGGALRNVSGDNSWAGSITIENSPAATRINSDSGTLTLAAIGEAGNASKTLTFGGAGNVTVNGIISGGPDMGVAKDGAGTLTLNAANTYDLGTTVTGGTLLVNNTTGSGTGPGTVAVSNSGTILGGTGTISGAVTVAANSILQGGTGTTGATQKLTLTGVLTLADNSIIQLALGPSGAHSILARTGTNTWTFDSNQAFAFIDLGATTGTYDNIITGIANPPSENLWTITNSGWTGTFTYDGANIDLTLTAVPEPSTWIAGALALGVLGWTQRKRLRKLARFRGRANRKSKIRDSSEVWL